MVVSERQKLKVKLRRAEWFEHRTPAIKSAPERMVFIDETAVKTNPTRQRGWTTRGKRLEMDAPFGSSGTQTFIAGLSANALIAPWVRCVPGSSASTFSLSRFFYCDD
ncbi:transposase [Pseudovibrio axinellae]|uniref:transposase n=1 Tax=Pseudovibrio axinellae TaxID=989403 RepID=UPI000832C033|nr:transposase [Pseudovibrio axinellae]